MKIKIERLFDRDKAGLLFGFVVDWTFSEYTEFGLCLGVCVLLVRVPRRRKQK